MNIIGRSSPCIYSNKEKIVEIAECNVTITGLKISKGLFGIYMGGIDRQLTNITIRDNEIRESLSAIISVNCANCSIENNIIKDCGVDNTKIPVGIELHKTNNTRIINNTINLMNCTERNKYCIFLGDSNIPTIYNTKNNILQQNNGKEICITRTLADKDKSLIETYLNSRNIFNKLNTHVSWGRN